MQSLTLMKRRLHGFKEVNRDLAGMDLRAARAYGSSWDICKFTKTRLDGADFQGSTFLNCSFVDVSARMANFSACQFHDCEFEDSNFSQANFAGSVFHENLFARCDFSYASFADSTMRKLQDFIHCNFHGTDLSFMETEGPGFYGCNMWGARIPWGCQVFSGQMSTETVQFGLAMLANVCQEMSEDLKGEITRLAGESATAVVGRLMRNQDEHNESA